MAVAEAAQLLNSLGHHVEEVEPPFRREDLTEIFVVMTLGEANAELRRMADKLGRAVTPADVEETTYAMYLLGNAYTAGEYAYYRARWNDVARRMGRFHEQYDLLLTPTLAMEPFPIGSLQPTAAERQVLRLVNRTKLQRVLRPFAAPLAERIFRFIPYTPFANMTGQPAISVPLHWTADGLPIGVMFTAALYREDVLLRLAAQLEEAKPWFERVPM